MLPRLLRSFLFFILFAANYLPVDLCAGNFLADADGSDDELYALYFADTDGDLDESVAQVDQATYPACDFVADAFKPSAHVLSTLIQEIPFFVLRVKDKVPLYIRKRTLLI